jgi:hypothetical protein
MFAEPVLSPVSNSYLPVRMSFFSEVPETSRSIPKSVHYIISLVFSPSPECESLESRYGADTPNINCMD